MYIAQNIVMKKYTLTLYFLLQTLISVAQKELFAFPIENYALAINDSIILVKIQLPTGIASISKGQLAQLEANVQNDYSDSIVLGSGSCNMILRDYYYFAIQIGNRLRKPKKNDLITTLVTYPANYKGLIYQLIKQSIYLDHVTGIPFYNFNTAASLSMLSENSLLDSLKQDIQYTGKKLQENKDEQDQLIKGGDFNGKKLFAAMQEINTTQVKRFVNYMISQPTVYSGNHWKIAEIFATWMVRNTPAINK